MEKCYCLSVGKVSYGREMTALGAKYMRARPEGNPTHRLVVHHLKGAWTTSNREVAFALFDSFMKNKVQLFPNRDQSIDKALAV